MRCKGLALHLSYANLKFGIMKHIHLFSICLLAYLFVNIIPMSADVLGPYIASETIATPEGYASVVPYMSSPYPVTGTISIQDENGGVYKLSVLAPQQSPYRYFLSYGTYKIISMIVPDGAKLQSNWGALEVGSFFTVTSVGGYIGVYWEN